MTAATTVAAGAAVDAPATALYGRVSERAAFLDVSISPEELADLAVRLDMGGDELSALEGELGGVRNYNITAKKQGGTLVFLRKIVRGAADDSYGIEVAKLAGLPDSVISKAKGYLKELESSGIGPAVTPKAADDQISLADVGADEVRDILLRTDVNTLTPLEAMNLLFELQKKARA